jgi:hypothetical protein
MDMGDEIDTIALPLQLDMTTCEYTCALLCTGVVSVAQNAVLPSVLSYACLPYARWTHEQDSGDMIFYTFIPCGAHRARAYTVTGRACTIGP